MYAIRSYYENNLIGSHTLSARLYDPDGALVFDKDYQVDIIGGTRNNFV